MKMKCFVLVAITMASCTTRTSESAPGKGSSLGRAAPPSNAAGDPRQVVKSPRPEEAALNRVVVLKTIEGEERLWMSEDMVVEFDPTPQGRAALLHSDPAGVEIAQGQVGVRVWRISASQGIDVFSSNLSTGSTRFSPVLHSAPSRRSGMLALPGGVIATFPETWTRTRIDGWLAERSLRVERVLVDGQNMVLISTAPGLGCVEISNQLVDSGELVSCEPNFWRQAQTR